MQSGGYKLILANSSYKTGTDAINDQLDQMITRIYEIAKNRSMERVLSHGDDDFSFAIPGRSVQVQGECFPPERFPGSSDPGCAV